MKEQWKPIKDFEGYEVSNLGRVKSLNYNHTGKEKLLSPGKSSDGYFFVGLYKNGIKKSVRINRLVWQTFVGEIPEGLQVNHIDEDKENNRVENLNLMTSKENNNWATANARRAAALRGKKQSPEAVTKRVAALSKAVEAIDKVTGKIIFTFPSINEAQRQGFNQSAVSQCCNGKVKSYKGFIWKYREN